MGEGKINLAVKIKRFNLKHFISHTTRRIYGRIQTHIIVPARTNRTARIARENWRHAGLNDYAAMQRRTLEYVESMRVAAEGRGAYAYKEGGPPLLYASCYAALTLHLCGRLQQLPAVERATWVAYIRSFQDQDGLFRDPLIACPFADIGDWWGWKHLTILALMALTALGAKAENPFGILEPFRGDGSITSWLATRNWTNDTPSVSNEVQNIGTLMQYSRDFFGQSEWNVRLDELYTGLDRRQHPATGLWGGSFRNRVELSHGVQSAYHFWLLYFYDQRKIRYASEALNSCLRSQTPQGGFGYYPNTSACEDIDSIDPIARFLSLVPAKGAEVKVGSAAERALQWVLANQNPDGGWVFRRHVPFNYGHDLMSSASNESAMFPTWFRLLSLSYLARILVNHSIAQLDWHFLRAPGLQYWNPTINKTSY